MSRTLGFCILMLSVTMVCFAQSNREESLVFTTYYPAPYGVYKNVKLTPSEQPDTSKPALNQAGIMYFNNSTNEPYVHNGTGWTKIGGGGGSNFYSGNTLSPGSCNGTISSEPYNIGQLCSKPWFEDISFAVPFAKRPHVLVTLLVVPSDTFSPCAANVTDQYIGYPENITEKGFRLLASGSPLNFNSTSRVTCYEQSVASSAKYDRWFTRAIATWFAISD
jgi:hypothetical protein